MDSSEQTSCVKAVYHNTQPQVAGYDWDVYLITDASGRVLRFAGDDSPDAGAGSSQWMTARDPADGDSARRLRWLVEPLLRQLSALPDTAWRLDWHRHGGGDSSCILQVRIPRPNALPEAVPYVARPSRDALSPAS